MDPLMTACQLSIRRKSSHCTAFAKTQHIAVHYAAQGIPQQRVIASGAPVRKVCRVCARARGSLVLGQLVSHAELI